MSITYRTIAINIELSSKTKWNSIQKIITFEILFNSKHTLLAITWATVTLLLKINTLTKIWSHSMVTYHQPLYTFTIYSNQCIIYEPPFAFGGQYYYRSRQLRTVFLLVVLLIQIASTTFSPYLLHVRPVAFMAALFCQQP